MFPGTYTNMGGRVYLHRPQKTKKKSKRLIRIFPVKSRTGYYFHLCFSEFLNVL